MSNRKPKETQKNTEEREQVNDQEHPRTEPRADRAIGTGRTRFGPRVPGGTDLRAASPDGDAGEADDDPQEDDIPWAERSFGPRCRTPRPRDPGQQILRGSGREFVVDPRDPTAFTEIDDAVAAAEDGDRILVRPGTYTTPVVVDRAVSIEGTGELALTVLQPLGGEAIGFAASGGRVERLTIRPARTGNDGMDWSAVAVHDVEAIVEGCTLSSHLGATVCVGGPGSSLLVIDCDLVDGAQHSVWVTEGGRARIAASRIAGHAWSATDEDRHSELRIEGCDLVDNLGDGASATGGALLVVENSTIRRNAGNGVCLTNAAPASRVTGCTIEGNMLAGVLIVGGRSAEIRGNRIVGNDAGVGVMGHAAPVVTGNTIEGNCTGVGSRGEGAEPLVAGTVITRSSVAGISVDEEAGGQFDGNTVGESRRWGIWLDNEGTLARFSGNQVSASGREAVFVSNGAAGHFSANDLRGNHAGSWTFTDPGSVVRDGNLEDLGAAAGDPLGLIRQPWVPAALPDPRLVN